MEDIQLFIKWDDITCPICLNSPHNAVLLQCSSSENGCRSFVCDTDHLHSNCLNRFKQANGISTPNSKLQSSDSDSSPENKPSCPLCRGEVKGWVTVDLARTHLNSKKRHCEEENCRFTGTYSELQNHVESEHPHACPSKVDPARQLDWENFQQSSEIIDVLSTIHTEIPRGVVLGDYVIEYGDDDNSGDEDFEGFRREGNWWKSCMLYQVFENFRAARNRRRLRVVERRRMSYDGSYNFDEGSPVSSVEYGVDYNERDDDFVNARRISTGRAGHQHSPRRRRSRFY